QDNELTWMDWSLTPDKRTLLDFTTKMVRFRLTQPTLRRRKYFQGRSIRGGGVKDVAWLTPGGGEMDDSGWNTGSVRSLGMLLSGSAIEETNERGEVIIGDTLFVLLNGHSDTVSFTLPLLDADQQWQRAFDTFDPHGPDKGFDGGKQYNVQGRSIVCFKLTSPLRRRVSDTNDAAAAVEAAVQA